MKDINIETSFFAIFELKRKYGRVKKDNCSLGNRGNELALGDDLKNNKVWSIEEKSELIESILIGLTVAPIYLSEDKFGNLTVVDGRQRLTALFEFLDNKYVLTGLQILKELNGKTFNEIAPIYQCKLEDYKLITQVIKPPTPEFIKLQILDRLNRR